MCSASPIDNGDERRHMVRAGTTVKAKIAAPTQPEPAARTGIVRRQGAKLVANP